MSGSGAQRSWRDCRAFLVDLEQHALRSAAGQGVPHVESCSSCAALVKSAAAQIEVLRRLPRPVAPRELSSRGFLEDIHARAGEAAERRLRPVLDRALGDHHLAAPADADWIAAQDPEEFAASLARSLPSGPTPGWLWTRIQTEVRTLIRGRRRARRSRRVQVAGLLAAGLLASVIVLRPFLVSEDEGATVAFADVPIVQVTMPLDSAYSMDAFRSVGEQR